MKERRRRRRFPLQCPVVLKIRDGIGWREVHGFSEDVSELGVSLLTGSILSEGAEIELTMVLTPDIRLFCPGSVVRVERRMDASKVAVECARPLEEI